MLSKISTYHIELESTVHQLINRVNEEALKLAEEYGKDGYIWQLKEIGVSPSVNNIHKLELGFFYEIEKTEHLQYEEERLRGGL